MTTAISTVTSDYPVLDSQSREAQILAQNLGGDPITERDLGNVRTPAGGSTTFNWDMADGTSESAQEITGLLVANAGRGILWPSQDPTGAKPLVTTHDLRVGYQTGEDFGDVSEEDLAKFRQEDGTYDWQAMSNSKEFGFGSAGRGKRVKESHVLAILRPGQILPVLIHLGTASLSSWSRFKRALTVLPHEAVVTVSLEKVKNAGGQPYSRMKFALAGTISPDEGSRVFEMYTKPLTAMLERKPYVPQPSEPVPF